MLHVSRPLRSLVALALLASLSGCGLFGGTAAPPADEPELPPGPSSVTLVGDDNMNAAGGTVGNAARVYLYPLASTATFLSTPVQAFWQDPEALLADDLAGTVRDVAVRPGSTVSLDEVTLEGAAFLGVAVDLRAPEADTWRTALPAAQVRGSALRIRVTEGGVSVTAPPPAPTP